MLLQDLSEVRGQGPHREDTRGSSCEYSTQCRGGRVIHLKVVPNSSFKRALYSRSVSPCHRLPLPQMGPLRFSFLVIVKYSPLTL